MEDEPKGFEIKCLKCGKAIVITNSISLWEKEIEIRCSTDSEPWFKCPCGNEN